MTVSLPSFPDLDIAIVGGGAAGVLTALHLLRAGRRALRLALIEPAEQLADGIAYATARPEHLLNVPAGKMSAFPEQPGDFVDFLRGLPEWQALAPAELGQCYVPRLHYGHYLRSRLQQACAASAATLQVLRDRVVGLDRHGAGYRLTLAGAPASMRVGAVVLAVGNALRPLPLRGATSLEPRYRAEAWDTEAVAAIPAEASLCILGSGLSMADSIVTLHARNHRGPVHVVSRHGLMPLPHAATEVAELALAPLLALSLRGRMRALRAQVRQAAARGIAWQGVMEALRPHGQVLWRSLTLADQRRFLRHVVRYWDVHRHRIAPEVHARVQAMRASGQLRLHRARLDAVFAQGACVQLSAQADGRVLHLDVHQVVNATGVEMRVQAMRNPLLQQLVGQGLAMPGLHGIGVDTDDHGCLRDAAGQADPRLRVIGSLRIGSLWESLAVPELRQQAAEAAAALAAT